jgi:hypothetical protein
MSSIKSFGLQTKVTLKHMMAIILMAMLSNGCSNSPSNPVPVIVSQSNPTHEPNPAEEILVTYGRYDKPFARLGPVEYTLKNPSTTDDNFELWDQAIEQLKQAALTRFGDKVDAIINVEIVESTESSIIEQFNIIHAKGIAISFTPGTRPSVKHRAKYKARPPSKQSSNKTKPSIPKKAPEKAQPEEEIEISPSELLK